MVLYTCAHKRAGNVIQRQLHVAARKCGQRQGGRFAFGKGEAVEVRDQHVRGVLERQRKVTGAGVLHFERRNHAKRNGSVACQLPQLRLRQADDIGILTIARRFILEQSPKVEPFGPHIQVLVGVCQVGSDRNRDGP